MMRFGRPFAEATCQPSTAPVFAGLLPPTLVAMPEWNVSCSFTGSHDPQKPAYTLAPRERSATTWLPGSSLLATASGEPGFFCVPRSKTTFQSVSLSGQVGSVDASPGTFEQLLVVSSQLVVSTIWRPPVT